MGRDWDMIYGKNAEGYSDPTATTAVANITRSERGRRNKRAGEQFENIIANSLEWYRTKECAFVEKTPEPMRPLSKPNNRGQFTACYIKSGQPDFKGTIKGGKCVVFEAKHTDADYIEYGRLTPNQAESLSMHYRLGAAAFIAVSFGLIEFYRIPWEIWAQMKTIYGRKYIKKSEISEYRIKYKNGILALFDDIDGNIDSQEVNGYMTKAKSGSGKRKVTVSQAQLKRERVKEGHQFVDTYTLIFLWALHESEGFGEKRLARILEKINQTADLIAERRLSSEDIRVTLREETGLEFRR